MAYFWICGVCGMEQYECDAETPLAAAAIAQAMNPNYFPTRLGQNTSKGYSNVFLIF